MVENSGILGTVCVKIFKPGKSVLWIYLGRCQWVFACSVGLHMGIHGFINGIPIFLEATGWWKEYIKMRLKFSVHWNVIRLFKISVVGSGQRNEANCQLLQTKKWKDGHTIRSFQLYVSKCCFWYKENKCGCQCYFCGEWWWRSQWSFALNQNDIAEW